MDDRKAVLDGRNSKCKKDGLLWTLNSELEDGHPRSAMGWLGDDLWAQKEIG